MYDVDKLSRIDPAYAPAAGAYGALGSGAGVDVDIGGRQVRLFPGRTIGAHDVAEIDDVRSFAFDRDGRLYLVDRAGGVWIREAGSGWNRRYLGAVKEGAEFVLIAKDDRDVSPCLGLRSGGRLSEVMPTGIKPCNLSAPLVWRGRAEASGECDGIAFKATPDGFRLTNKHGLDLGISANGWTSGGGSVDVSLALHDSEGPLLLFSGMSFSGERLRAFVPVGANIRLSDIRPLGSGRLLPRSAPAGFRVGHMEFARNGQLLEVRSSAGHRYRMLSGGGLAVDLIDRAAAIRSPDGTLYLVHSAGDTGDVYCRKWSDAGLGDPILMARPYGASIPSEIFAYDGGLYAVFPQGWAAFRLLGGTPCLEPVASMVAEWAKRGSPSPSASWRYDGSRLEHKRSSDGTWELVPYSVSGGFSLAFDRPSWAPSAFRHDASQGIIYRSSMKGPGELWYLKRGRSSLPEAFTGALPAPFTPATSRQFDTALGTSSRLDSATPDRYSLKVDGVDIMLGLSVAEGIRMPHLRVKPPFIPQSDGLVAMTCQSSDGRKVFLAVEPDTGSARCTLKIPGALPVRNIPAKSSQCEISSSGLRFGWKESGEIYLESSSGGDLLQFELGKFVSNEPLQLDDPGKVRLLRVDTQSVAFRLAGPGECYAILPRDSLFDLTSAKLARVRPDKDARDPFSRRAPGSSARMAELRTPDTSGSLPAEDASPAIATIDGGGVALRTGVGAHLLPLQQVKKGGFWALPFCDVVSASRSVAGDYFVQSSGGAWLARYDGSLCLVDSRSLDPATSSGRLVADSSGWSIWWQDSGSASALNLGKVDIPPAQSKFMPAFEAAASLMISKGQGGSYSYAIGGTEAHLAAQREYPGCRIDRAFLVDGGKINLFDGYGCRTLSDGVLGPVTASHVAPVRVLGVLSGNGMATASCGKWVIKHDGDAYAVSVGGRSILSASGAPFADKVKDADATIGELALDVESYVALLDENGVRLVLRRDLVADSDSAVRPACHYVLADDTSERLLSTWGLGADLVRPLDGAFAKVSGGVSLPYASIEARGLSIVGADAGGTLQMRLAEKSAGSAYQHKYDGSRMFVGAQLSVDCVNSVAGTTAGVVIEHPADGAGRTPIEAFAWQSVVPRSGPQTSIDVPAQLLHPWSEPRDWQVDGGGVRWLEKGARWGD